MLKGLQNFLELINNNWTTICVIIGLLIGIYEKVKKLFKKNAENKIELNKEEVARQIDAAKQQIHESMLKMITDAEEDYDEWFEAGEIKRSQVIKQIFEEYPILSRAVDQEAVVVWIDEQINDSLKTLRRIIATNREVPNENQ